MKKLNVGLIGYGFMGRTHSNAFRKVGNFFDLEYQPILKAVCGRDPAKVQAFAHRWGYESTESDWRKLIRACASADRSHKSPTRRLRETRSPCASARTGDTQRSRTIGCCVCSSSLHLTAHEKSRCAIPAKLAKWRNIGMPFSDISRRGMTLRCQDSDPCALRMQTAFEFDC